MKPQSLTLTISIALFVASLTQTAVNMGSDYMLSIACLLLGWAEVLKEELHGWQILFIYFMVITYYKTAQNICTSKPYCFLLSLSYLSVSTITVNEGGGKAEITSYDLGYYLWLASSISMSIGSIWTIISNRRPIPEKSSV